MYAPMWVLSRFLPQDSSVLFNLLVGAIRIGLFLLYLSLISLWSEIRRIFEYHGAEHKAIFAYEDGKEVQVSEARPYSTFHPRCGTSFLFIVSLICMLLFSIFDKFFIEFVGPYPNVFARLIVHLVLVPVVSGISYEFLKLSDKYQNIPLVGLLIKPGLWLQKITTRQPDDKQLEIAISALKAAI
jgi:uncharacterized protein YqhQ